MKRSLSDGALGMYVESYLQITKNYTNANRKANTKRRESLVADRLSKGFM